MRHGFSGLQTCGSSSSGKKPTAPSKRLVAGAGVAHDGRLDAEPVGEGAEDAFGSRALPAQWPSDGERLISHIWSGQVAGRMTPAVAVRLLM